MQLLTGTQMHVVRVATVKHQGLGLSLTHVPLTVKHMTYPQKASEQAEVNTKVGGKKSNSCYLHIKERRQQVVWVTKFALKNGW